MQLNSVQDLHKGLIKSNDFKQIKSHIEQLSQIYIIADHQNQEIFEYLAENKILSLFYDQINNSLTNNAFFILSKLSFIISNLKNPLNINYVLSNPILNEFINHQYDFSNQEMVDYYVNFLKIIAIRINRENIYLYFNQRYSSFPLLWQAQKFINYPDILVNNTIKIIILSLSKLFNLNEDVSLTQSIVKQENLIISKFKNYLLHSPFILAYQKFIHNIKQILLNITKTENQEQLEELLMFFNDIIIQCPFLIPLFEKIMLQQLILPILDYLLLNKKKDIKIEFKIGFYFIHQILNKLPFNKVLIYFSQDMIPDGSHNLLKYIYDPTKNWVYEKQNYEQDFAQLFLDDNNNLLNTFENTLNNTLTKNNYKNQMLLLLTPKENNNILLFQLAIWQIMKKNQRPWPIQHIIQLLSQSQNQIIYSQKVIDYIIFFFVNENIDQLKNVYLDYENKVRQLIINAKKDHTQLSQALIINWEIILNFDWNQFTKSLPIITFNDLQNWEYEKELTQLKLVYIWLLLKCLVMNFKKESSSIKYIPNQEISHLTDDLYFQIDQKRTYLIINQVEGYLILTRPCSNPNRGIITFAYPFASLSCTQDNDHLKFECNKLAINQVKPFKVQIPKDQMNEILLKIKDAKRELQNNIFDQLQQLIK